MANFQEEVLAGIPQDHLPEAKPYDKSINHAPRRKDILSPEQNHRSLAGAEHVAGIMKRHGRHQDEIPGVQVLNMVVD